MIMISNTFLAALLAAALSGPAGGTAKPALSEAGGKCCDCCSCCSGGACCGGACGCQCCGSGCGSCCGK